MPDSDPMESPPASDAMALTPQQHFEIERHMRLINDIDDETTLRNLAKQFLALWMQQKAATAWAMRQQWGL